MNDLTPNIFHLLAERAHGPHGSEPALHWEGKSLRWDGVESAVRQVAGGLQKLGVTPGDRIAVMLPNIPPYLFLQYAAHLLGAILVPVHEMVSTDELSFLLEDCEPTLFFSWSEDQERVSAALHTLETTPRNLVLPSGIEDPYEVSSWLENGDSFEGEAVGGGDDTALIRYTAGVSGRPKGAMLSHANILYAAHQTHRALHILSLESLLGAIPFYHPFGSTLQLQMLLPSGAALHLLTDFDPDRALELIREKQVSLFVGLPMHFSALLDRAIPEGEPPQLRFAICGGGPLDPAIANRFETVFQTHIATIYGTCETSPTIAVNPAHLEETPRDALGRALSGTDISILDEANREVPIGEVGEIVVRGPGVFTGYWNRPNATSLAIDAEGWFHTSDLGRLDLDGWLCGVSRLQDRINKGGFSVYPREVEQVLDAHPSVLASAVAGIPDNKLGEEIVAFVIPRTNMVVVEEEVIEYCAERLARFKAPKRIMVVQELPRSPNGALLRRRLRDEYLHR